MKQFITGHDIANTVRMAHLQRDITYLLVEGETDLYLFKSFVLSDRCEVIPCHGRSNTINAVIDLDSTSEPGFLAIVDADFDLLERRNAASSNTILTDYHDIEIVILESPALDKLLREKGGVSKIASFEAAQGKSVRSVVLERAVPFGCFRLLNHMKDLGLRFEDLQYARLVDRNTLTVSLPQFVQTVIQRSSKDLSAETLVNEINSLMDENYDPRLVCCGHDVVALLGIALRHSIGSQLANETRVEILERDLRLAFDQDYFERTVIHTKIRTWESRNTQWAVLPVM